MSAPFAPAANVKLVVLIVTVAAAARPVPRVAVVAPVTLAVSGEPVAVADRPVIAEPLVLASL
ncbi:hypothetical protein D3C76_1695370 [compost metagenome]